MKNKPDPADSSLSETMAARIEIKELGDPAHQKKITDAVEALDGVIDTKNREGPRCTSRTICWQQLKRKSSSQSVFWLKHFHLINHLRYMLARNVVEVSPVRAWLILS